ncbi:MAG: UDP-glucose/GDP-mannose dehydrogenase family protein [Candidatus Lokiarchaeota archaeon]|nr:UDP-glucose/GDP-mannose dehydrogenase family protein [Candidatus Lokiarchaeota archaeon]
MTLSETKIAIHGTGFIGLVSGCCFAIKGFKTINSTYDQIKCDQINKGETPFYENGLEELLREALATKNFKCVVGRKYAVLNSDVSMIAVGTPMGKDYSINLTFIEKIAEEIGQILQNHNQYHLIVVRSTVVPGTTRNLVGKRIEKLSGKKMGEDFGLCMQPEFLAEGRSILDTLEPDRIIIGELDKKSGDILQKIYGVFYEDHLNNCPILRMNLESAELVKYGNNCLLATKISYANEMSRIAELVPGVDIVQVMRGVGLDYRINEKFLRAGVGFGGSCFPKDVNAIISFARAHGYDARLLRAIMEINEDQAKHTVDLLENELKEVKNKKIALLGLAFKPGTNDMRFAPSIRIIDYLLEKGAQIIGWDPVAEEEAFKIMKNSILYADKIEEALLDADGAIIVTEWDEISQLQPNDFKKSMKTPIVVDGRRILDPTKFQDEITLLSIGKR